METTDTQNLPYPEVNDPGDGALDLQILAEAIDAKLVAAFTGFRNVINAPVYMSYLANNDTGFATTPGRVGFDTEVFNTTGSVQTPDSPVFVETGYYRIGCYVISNPAGTVNANTLRTVNLQFRQQLAIPPAGVILEDAFSTNWESVTGSEQQVVENLIRVDSIDAPGSFIQVLFSSSNSSSTTTVLVGSRLWLYKVSELEDL